MTEQGRVETETRSSKETKRCWMEERRRAAPEAPVMSCCQGANRS